MTGCTVNYGVVAAVNGTGGKNVILGYGSAFGVTGSGNYGVYSGELGMTGCTVNYGVVAAVNGAGGKNVILGYGSAFGMTGSGYFLGICMLGILTGVGLNTGLGTGGGSGDLTVVPNVYDFYRSFAGDDGSAILVDSDDLNGCGGFGLELTYYEVRCNGVYYVSTVDVDTVVACAVYVCPVELNLTALVLVGRDCGDGDRIVLFRISYYADCKGERKYERKHSEESENSSQRV